MHGWLQRADRSSTARVSDVLCRRLEPPRRPSERREWRLQLHHLNDIGGLRGTEPNVRQPDPAQHGGRVLRDGLRFGPFWRLVLWDLHRGGSTMDSYECCPSRQHDFEDRKWKRLQFVCDHGGYGERKCPGRSNEYTRSSWFNIRFDRQLCIQLLAASPSTVPAHHSEFRLFEGRTGCIRMRRVGCLVAVLGGCEAVLGQSRTIRMMAMMRRRRRTWIGAERDDEGNDGDEEEQQEV